MSVHSEAVHSLPSMYKCLRSRLIDTELCAFLFKSKFKLVIRRKLTDVLADDQRMLLFPHLFIVS